MRGGPKRRRVASGALRRSRRVLLKRKRQAQSEPSLQEVCSEPSLTESAQKRQLLLLPSAFEDRPPVLLFSYTKACGAAQRCLARAVPADPEGLKMYYCHTAAVHEYNAVLNTLRQGGLYRIREGRWALQWSSQPSADLLRNMRASQRTNHFPGSWQLGRKDLLWRNISRMRRRFGQSYEITPQGYVLPKAVGAWERARRRRPDGLWIWKPCSASCGRGIRVLGSIGDEEATDDFGRRRGVVQRYVPDPLLIDGYKFDLRVYAVVLSFDPLKVYLNDEGLVRLATEKYSADPATLGSRTMHLTNYSVNKLSAAFVQNQDGSQAQSSGQPASKWSFRELREHLEHRGLDYERLLQDIGDVVIKSLLAVEPTMRAHWAACLGASAPSAGWASLPGGAHPASCFELYGFDVLVDQQLKPWLLEVNVCPSLSSGSPLDKRIKTQLVADTLTLCGLRPPPSLARSAVLPGGPARPRAPRVPRPEASWLAARSPSEAVAAFDEDAWLLVLDAVDEDLRCGSLRRVFPSADASQYTQFWEEESFANVVLRKWHEAGGMALLPGILPAWLPQQRVFSST